MVVHKKCHQFVVVKCPGCKKTNEEDVSYKYEIEVNLL